MHSHANSIPKRTHALSRLRLLTHLRTHTCPHCLSSLLYVFTAPRLFAVRADGLAEENGLASILSIASAYDELMLAHKKEVYCTIITSQVGGCTPL